MNFSDMYNDKLSNLVKYREFIKHKILEKEISILKSEKFFPELVDFVYDNFLYILVYIYAVRNDVALGKECHDESYVNFNEEYALTLYSPEEVACISQFIDDYGFYPWDICPQDIVIEEGYYLNLSTPEDEYRDGYEYEVSFEFVKEYSFLADIFEQILIKNKDDIYKKFLESKGIEDSGEVNEIFQEC